MKKYHIISFLTVTLLCFCASSHAQSEKVITLKDGSILKGNVLQLKDNIYTLETSNLGEINIPESDILSISSSEILSGGDEAQNAELKNQVEQMQETMLSDPEIIEDIEDILSDESVATMLSDPKLLEDVTSFDQKKIEQNDSIQNLMNNPKIQKLMNKIQQQMPAQE